HSSALHSLSSDSEPSDRVLHSFPTRRSSDLANGSFCGANLGFCLSLTGRYDLWILNSDDPLDPANSENSIRFFEARSPDKFWVRDRKSTRLNSSHVSISYAVFCLKKKNKQIT